MCLASHAATVTSTALFWLTKEKLAAGRKRKHLYNFKKKKSPSVMQGIAMNVNKTVFSFLAGSLYRSVAALVEPSQEL